MKQRTKGRKNVMNRYLMKFSKCISIVLLVFVTLSCPFWELTNDSNSANVLGNETLQWEQKIAGTLSATEIISSGEIFSPSLQALMVKRLSVRRNGCSANEIQVSDYRIARIWSVTFLTFFLLCLSAFTGSHRVILRYIHSMDGKKA
ncbi:MAG: hypothetical protein ACI4F0_08870 [Agathobacter sp.]